jgi:cytochrome c biogenesis protein
VTDIRDGIKTAGTKQDPGDVSFGKAIWDFFSSMRTAITLLLVLAATSIVGTIIPQGAMRDAMVHQYGLGVYKFIHALSLDNAYDSAWYVGLLVLIGINLAVCSIKRFGATWRATATPKVIVSEKQVSLMQRSETISAGGSAEHTMDRVETALSSSSYHVLTARDGDASVIYAAKGRLSIWGPYLTHVSILVIFIGAIIGGRLGYSGVTLIREGGYTDSCYLKKTGSEKKLGFRVDLRKFMIGYDADHNPTSYKSDLQVFQGNKPVAARVIDVNRPLTYKGVTFYQSDFGLDGIVLKLTAPDGQTTRVRFRVDTQEGRQGRQYSITGASGDMPFEQVVLAGKRLTVYAHDFVPDYIGGEAINATQMPLNPAVLVMVNDRLPEYKGLDAWTKLGWLPISKSAKYKGFTIEVEDAVDYTVLQVARNPGLPIVYTGFALILFGVFVSFYVMRKVIRVRVSPAATGASVLIGGNSRSDPSVFDDDFAAVTEALGNG